MISTTNDFDALGYLLPRYLRVDNILDATTAENIEGKCMEPIANILELPWIERFYVCPGYPQKHFRNILSSLRMTSENNIDIEIDSNSKAFDVFPLDAASALAVLSLVEFFPLTVCNLHLVDKNLCII